MDQAYAKALKIQIQSRADPDLRAAQDENVLSDLGDPLPERTEKARPDQGGPEKIPRSMNDLILGKLLRRNVIAQVDHFEAGPVQAVFVKEMDPGTVPLVVAGDALEFQGTTGTRGKDYAVEPVFSNSGRDPVGTVGMTGGKDHFPMDYFRSFRRQFQYSREYG